MAETKTKSPKPPKEYITNTRLNVRTNAGYSSPIFKQNGVDCVLNKDETITVSKTKTADNVKWGMIDTDKWVCLAFCSEKTE